MTRSIILSTLLLAASGPSTSRAESPGPSRPSALDQETQEDLFGQVFQATKGKARLPLFIAFNASGGWANLSGVELRMALLPGQTLRLQGDKGTVDFRWRRLGRPSEHPVRLELTLVSSPGEKLLLVGTSLIPNLALRGAFCLQQGTGGRWSSGVRTEQYVFDGVDGVTMSATESVTMRGYSGSVSTGDVPGHYRIHGSALVVLLRAPGVRLFTLARDRTGKITALVSSTHRYAPCD